jgi:hypothetical protein
LLRHAGSAPARFTRHEFIAAGLVLVLVAVALGG